jgi:hypothetical protein
VSRAISPRDRAAFYAAAVEGLRALDARDSRPRRFGPDAASLWTQFAGALGPADRLDLLLRDASCTWGAAFSPAECFGFPGLAGDEPFGPDWGGLGDHAARPLLDPAYPPPTLTAIAEVLGASSPAPAIPRVLPSTKLVLAGGAAIVAVAKHFNAHEALSWADQVAVVANEPRWRQLAALAAVLLGARSRTALVRSTEGAEKLRALGFAHLDAAVVSADAEPEAAELARRLGGS